MKAAQAVVLVLAFGINVSCAPADTSTNEEIVLDGSFPSERA